MSDFWEQVGELLTLTLLWLLFLLPLIFLALSWAPDLSWVSPGIRSWALSQREMVYHQPHVRQLTVGWDWQRLRNAATVLVVLEAFGLLAARGLPVSLTGVMRIALLGLVVLQYGALGGGQPVWAIEHVFVHLMNLAGFSGADITALRQFARNTFGGRGHPHIFLSAQAVLVLIAIALAYSTHALRFPVYWFRRTVRGYG